LRGPCSRFASSRYFYIPAATARNSLCKHLWLPRCVVVPPSFCFFFLPLGTNGTTEETENKGDAAIWSAQQILLSMMGITFMETCRYDPIPPSCGYCMLILPLPGLRTRIATSINSKPS
jgi:hypothetical protein